MPPDFSALAVLLFAANPHPADHPSISSAPSPVEVNVALVRRLAEAEIAAVDPAVQAYIQDSGTSGGAEPDSGQSGLVVQAAPLSPPDTDAQLQSAESANGQPAQNPPAPDIPLTGDIIVVEGMTEAPPGDPLFQFNADTYEVVQDVDRAVVEPIANVYEDGLPRPVRKGLSNFFSNLREPIVFLNFLLQGKIGKAAETVGRFSVNSTLGIAGLVDVAKTEPFNLPLRRNGFANTLGFYGVDTGAFLYVPLIGPTTVRDLVGSGLDTLVMPIAFGDPFDRIEYGIAAYTVRALDERIELEDKYDRITDSDFPYATMRDTYLCERLRAIDQLRNRAPSECGPAALTPGAQTSVSATPETATPETAPPEAAPLEAGVDERVDETVQAE